MIRTKHEAGERIEPSECVVSYPNFQHFRTSPETFLMYQKKGLNGVAEWILALLALWNLGAQPKNVVVQGQLSWSTNIGFLNLFSYFEQHSSNLSIKDECLGWLQFLKWVEWPQFLKNSIFKKWDKFDYSCLVVNV